LPKNLLTRNKLTFYSGFSFERVLSTDNAEKLFM